MKRSPRVLSGGLALVLLILVLALLGGATWLALKLRQPKSPSVPAREMTDDPVSPIPAFFEKDLPVSCRQVALVVSPGDTSVTAELFLLVRKDGHSPWISDRKPIPVTLGRNGLAWGVGEHCASRPEGFREKREGDGCSPAGIFRVPFVFGMAPEADARMEAPGLTLPYTHLADSIIGVDDPDSHYYNQVVDSNLIPRDWNSHEPMNRFKVLYRWGAFIAHNPEGVPHLARASSSTSGRVRGRLRRAAPGWRMPMWCGCWLGWIPSRNPGWYRESGLVWTFQRFQRHPSDTA
ncbi:hypothetical protein [Verrucomicrobium spinosum]|uniref:hypothetical protein n=1 Tax=Verrucomicrobium spinosum TaxID=2736 RepID=UPI0012E105AB|nr:hypothetical protein [Verrucomicrobium spinosum]